MTEHGYDRPVTNSEAVLCGTPIEVFIGHRLDCKVCKRPFRCFRKDETHCGCCRHLKARRLNPS